MTAFRYRAVDANGRELDGILEADTQRQIRSQLRERGLFPVDVAPVSERGNTRIRRQRLSNADLTLLTRQWATLIAAGLTIEQTLSAAIDQSESASTRQLIAGIRNEITAGHSLSEALNRYPTVFPPIYRALIRSGEKSGELEQILLRLADYLENRHALRQKILQALLYPALVTLVALGVIGGMMAFVVPQVVGVFRHSKQALPFLTQALVWISDFLRIAGPWLLLAGVLGLIGGLRLLRHEATRRRFHRSVLQVPILGRLLRTLDSARFAQTLSILVGGGVPLLNALEAGRDVMLLLPLRDSVGNAIGRVREGSGLARALSQDKQLPPLLLHLIASGEASGELGPMLERAAKQQQDEVSNRTALLVGILEPLLILAMGGIVLLIVLAVLQPIIEINQVVR
jgi:general secretion pathway protein F